MHQTEAAMRQSETATRETAGVFGDYAERAVLIPVGAALLARDRVVSSVGDTLSTYSSGTKAQAQLRRFERRGVTARNRLEREVRKARVRVERELRQRRRRVEKPRQRPSTTAAKSWQTASPSSPTRRPGAHPQPGLGHIRNRFPRPDRRGPGKRESLPASYPAGSSSTLSSPRPAGGPHRPRVI